MERKQLTLFASLFAVVVAVLTLFYLLVLRQDYVTLFADLREQDTAQIVAELEGNGLDYRLGDGGQRILVPADTVDEARIAIAGSGISMGGVVGFELFNESDMGLTEFAQQVNYQRALQGELARTIMMMDGIAFARVHVSLPERALFRAEQQRARAAVTVQPQAGARIGEARVRGIQRLVANSVPELEVSDVSVLDQNGQLISVEVAPIDQAGSDLDEKAALEAYFRARSEAAAAPFLPGTDFSVRVSAIRITSQPEPASANEEDGETPAETPSGATPDRDFALNIALRTEFELASQTREEIRQAISNTVALQPANGDVVRFEVADLAVASGWGAAESQPASAVTAPAPTNGVQAAPVSDPWQRALDFVFSRWMLIVLLIIAIAALALRRRPERMSADERSEFSQQIEELLSRRQEAGHG